MPEKALKKLNTNILPQWKVCFFSALVAGLLAYLYKITNWLPNWDSIVFRYDSQNMLPLGRWFLPVVTSFTSFYDLPFLTGLVAIVIHALGAVVICKMFEVTKSVTAALTGAIIATFPQVTSVMMYNYVADGYAIAFLLSALSAYYMTKGKTKSYIFSAVLIAASAGIYQAYITVTVMLLLLYLINGVVFGGLSFKDVLKKGIFMLFYGAVGVVLYSTVLKVLLGFFSVELLDYQGASDTLSLSRFDLPASLYVARETFLDFFFDFSKGLSLYTALNILVVIFTTLGYIMCISEKKLFEKPANLLALIILCVMLPFGGTALLFVNPFADYHNLMLMGYSVFYLFFVLLYEKGAENKYAAVKCWTVLLIAVTIIANQIVTANVSFHKGQLAYEKSYGTLIRIADRIEQTEGSGDCGSIIVIGALEGSEAYGEVLPPDITGITDGYIIRADDESVNQSVLCSALNDYCGKNYKFLRGKEKEAFLKKDEVKEMKNWPAKESVAVIDDTVVIKLGAEGEK